MASLFNGNHAGNVMREAIINTPLMSEDQDCPIREIRIITVPTHKEESWRSIVEHDIEKRSVVASWWTKQRHRFGQRKAECHEAELPGDRHRSSRNMRTISLIGSPLQVIPGHLANGLLSLSRLCLSHCKILELPIEWDLPELKRLDLSFNSLRDFPEEVSNN